MSAMRRLSFAIPLYLLLLTVAAQAAPAKRFYVVVRGVENANGVKSGIEAEAQKLFTEELLRHPELTLTPPPGLAKDSDPARLKAALAKQHLQALELTLRILSVSQAIKPPAPGKVYRVLLCGIKLSVFGNSLPDKVLAIGGDGESQVGAEIGAHADLDREGRPLLTDAAKEAIKQAVDMTVQKLKLGHERPKLRRRHRS